MDVHICTRIWMFTAVFPTKAKSGNKLYRHQQVVILIAQLMLFVEKNRVTIHTYTHTPYRLIVVIISQYIKI